MLFWHFCKSFAILVIQILMVTLGFWHVTEWLISLFLKIAYVLPQFFWICYLFLVWHLFVSASFFVLFGIFFCASWYLLLRLLASFSSLKTKKIFSAYFECTFFSPSSNERRRQKWSLLLHIMEISVHWTWLISHSTGAFYVILCYYWSVKTTISWNQPSYSGST